ncbi:hypothetical protein CNO14_04520 (plasmid) [Borrelia miyamotoi]|uniref:Uncharacterized protein n=1 Tax=Borrelia miyamotoi TaxID=47466 RepID=A0AAP8YWZ0_9SPIR|nr:hypothetical protein [Borrelia miyamotoi]ATQ15270.1 hypothetical protein CNO14_04520 [Borrelia miyamotoi]ATQ17599.1 hypothetical protein CNO12_04525 [Borrelia miyamotoi]ATQ18843.1 hypothetical protein CNO11_04515 [Borrelia miyamotoi]ATQ20093.1 hypothetical protein CNO10_04525 [Borrelia miyamotoi]ATQ21323.1 hypothetical protein CNO09_04345 [Borrelia miyamotoi]
MKNFSIFVFLSILTLSCELDGVSALITDLMGSHEVVVAGAKAGNFDEVFALEGGDEEVEIDEIEQNFPEGVDGNVDQNPGNVDGHIVLVDAQGASVPAVVEHSAMSPSVERRVVTVGQNVESRRLTKVERLEKYLESAIKSGGKLNEQQRRLKNGKQMLFTWLNEDANASKRAELEQDMQKLYGLIKESITDSSSQFSSQDGEYSDEVIDGLLNSLFSSSFDNTFALDLFFQALLNTLYDFGRNNYRLADGIFADIRKVFSDESDTKGHFGYLKSKLKDELVISDEGDYEEDGDFEEED